MPTTIREKILFQIPPDRELAFAALSVMEQYVSHYVPRMRILDPNPQEGNSYELEYWTDMPASEKEFFANAGLSIRQQQEVSAPPSRLDAVFDLQPERINRFNNGHRHYSQGCAIACGVEAKTVPDIRQVRPRYPDTRWVDLSARSDFGERLLTLTDDQITGVIGWQSWETYLAAAMGLAVIEIVPKTRNRNWLSKWRSPFYRVVLENDSLAEQILEARRSLEEALSCMKPTH